MSWGDIARPNPVHAALDARRSVLRLAVSTVPAEVPVERGDVAHAQQLAGHAPPRKLYDRTEGTGEAATLTGVASDVNHPHPACRKRSLRHMVIG